VQLRDATRTLHQQVERALGLPAAIESLADYRRVLARYYGFYEPFEHALARFTEWQAIGVDLNDCCQAGRLTSDLQALGEAPERAVRAAKESLPSLPHFASALGALYVVEGSTLGSQFIVRYLTQLLGAQIQGADRFFHGRGSLTYEHWGRFRARLDLYGRDHPAETSIVIEGAAATFRAIGEWMQS
jgi:heme oxygenase